MRVLRVACRGLAAKKKDATMVSEKFGIELPVLLSNDGEWPRVGCGGRRERKLTAQPEIHENVLSGHFSCEGYFFKLLYG